MKSTTYWSALAQLRLANEGQSPVDRLKAFRSAFTSASRRVRRTALRGLYTRIDPKKIPPPNARPSRRHYCRSPQDLAWAARELSRWISQGILVPCSDPSALIHPYFVVSRNGKKRLVIDFLLLNQAILESPSVAYEDLSRLPKFLPKRAWMISIDIKSAFHHVPLSPSLRILCCIEFQGLVFCLTVMTFGVNIAPKIWVMLISFILDKLRTLGFRILVYMDDILLVHQKLAKLRAQTHRLLTHLMEHGLIISWEKSVLKPTRLIRHLGFLINSDSMVLTLPPDKIQDLSAFLRIAAQKPTLRLKSAMSLYGKVLAANRAFLPAKRYTWRLCSEIYSQLPPKANRRLRAQFRLRLSPETRDDLMWLSRNLPLAPSRPIRPPIPTHVVYTDASLTGWGAYCPTTNQAFAGKWSRHRSPSHIQVLEMLAVNHALACLQLPPRAEIHLYTDNQAVLAYLRNWGGTRSKELSQATYLVWDTLLKRQLSLARISYVPSGSNTVADYLSRLHRRPTSW